MTLDIRPLMTEDARHTLFLAEMAGLLHQVGKLARGFVEDPTGGFPFEKLISTQSSSLLAKIANARLPERLDKPGIHTPPGLQQWLLDHKIEGIPVGEILLLYWAWGRRGPGRELENRLKAIPGLQWQVIPCLRQCHNVASGVEKKGSGQANLSQQTGCFYVSSVFGTEDHGKSADDFEAALQRVLRLLEQLLSSGRPKRADLYRGVRPLFLEGMGDTQRPINDVTLWDISASVAALHKAAVAQAILEGWREPGTERWRLLRIGVDRLAFAERASRIPDLLGRTRVIDEALEEVREFIEETCPLGNEIYRDEIGSIFVVPDLQSELLSGEVDHGLSLQSRLEGIFSENTAGELMPRLFLGPPAREDLSLGALLQKPVGPPRRDVGRLSAFWSAGGGQEKCVVCGFRPQGGGAGSSRERALAKARHVCIVCLERSSGRVGAWLKDAASDEPRTTVWVDEASDDNGRCALLVGRFVLNRWLDGTMIRTLALGKDGAGNYLPKNPSFARIRRVWETTQRFWGDVRDNLAGAAGHGLRWKLTVQARQPTAFERCHVYELDVLNQPFPVVWDGSGLVTADNLAYAANVRGIDVQDGGWRTRLRGMLSGRFVVYEPGSYGGRRRAVADVTVTGVIGHSEFVPLIPIAAEPSLLMGVLPAKMALQAVRQIELHYAQEMGKVRNRLGLHVDLVFFPRKTPIPVVIDAGRRFLSMPESPEWWVIRSASGGRVEFENGSAWDLPTRLGDGSDDQYYPFFLAPAPASSTIQLSPWRQKFDFGSGGGDYQLLHGSELQPGTRVQVWPSRFDFQFLGDAADRFRIAYGGSTKRPGRRPYYLEQLQGHLGALWNLLAGPSGLTTSQIRRTFDVIEARRLAWGQSDQPDEVLVRLARDLWSTADWARQPARSDVERLARASTDGSLADVIELFMGVLKKKPIRDESPGDRAAEAAERTVEVAG